MEEANKTINHMEQFSGMNRLGNVFVHPGCQASLAVAFKHGQSWQ